MRVTSWKMETTKLSFLRTNIPDHSKPLNNSLLICFFRIFLEKTLQTTLKALKQISYLTKYVSSMYRKQSGKLSIRNHSLKVEL